MVPINANHNISAQTVISRGVSGQNRGVAQNRPGIPLELAPNAYAAENRAGKDPFASQQPLTGWVPPNIDKNYVAHESRSKQEFVGELNPSQSMQFSPRLQQSVAQKIDANIPNMTTIEIR